MAVDGVLFICKGGDVVSVEENKALVRHWAELLNQMEWDAFFKILAPEYVEHYTDHDESLEEAKQVLLNFRPLLSDYSLTIDHLLAEGDKVAYRVTHRSTHQPTGKKIQMTNTCIVRISEGEIAELWGSADTLHLMQQFGVLPPTEKKYGGDKQTKPFCDTSM